MFLFMSNLHCPIVLQTYCFYVLPLWSYFLLSKFIITELIKEELGPMQCLQKVKLANICRDANGVAYALAKVCTASASSLP